jgi:hypothetical protein
MEIYETGAPPTVNPAEYIKKWLALEGVVKAQWPPGGGGSHYRLVAASSPGNC